jgi:hypothetical protein
MIPELISTAYVMNLSHLYVYVYMPVVASRRLGKHVPVATNTHNSRRVVGTRLPVGLFVNTP